MSTEDDDIEIELVKAVAGTEVPDEKKTEPGNEKEDGPEKEENAQAEEHVLTVTEAAEAAEEKPATEPDEKPRLSRAERRIKTLTRQKKEASEALEAEREARKALEDENKRLKATADNSQQQSLEQYEARLNSAEEKVRSDWHKARGEGDTDAEWKATEDLATIKAEKTRLGDFKRRSPKPETESPPEEKPVKPEKVETEPKFDPQAMKWWNENKGWFKVRANENNGLPVGDNDISNRALDIHNDLMTEGYEVLDKPIDGQSYNDYYLELNRRLREEFPENFKVAERKKPVPRTVPGGKVWSRDGGKVKVRPENLTESQKAFCDRNGLKHEDYALELAKIEVRKGR